MTIKFKVSTDKRIGAKGLDREFSGESISTEYYSGFANLWHNKITAIKGGVAA